MAFLLLIVVLCFLARFTRSFAVVALALCAVGGLHAQGIIVMDLPLKEARSNVAQTLKENNSRAACNTAARKALASNNDSDWSNAERKCPVSTIGVE